MKFTKMQGLGNDYVYIFGSVPHPEETARLISNRHFGVGSDGLVLILPGTDTDFEMRMFNADGSEAEMCGNAARCVGKYVFAKGLTDKRSVTLKTGSGVRLLQMQVCEGKVESVAVEMGAPVFEPERIPTLLPGDRIIRQEVVTDAGNFPVTCVSMGNPHAVIFVEDADRTDVKGIGRLIENHPAFPARTNVEFVSVRDRTHLRMRVWERGSGETMACGTGACASLVAGVLCGLCEREAQLELNGGTLTVSWDEKTGRVFQQGPAEFVFEGEWPDETVMC